MTSGENITVKEICETLRRKPESARAFLRKEGIHHWKEGRQLLVHRADFDAYLAKRVGKAPAVDLAVDEGDMSVKEFAAAVGVTTFTVYAWLQRGRVKSSQPGGPRSPHRIPRSEVAKVRAAEAAQAAGGVL